VETEGAVTYPAAAVARPLRPYAAMLAGLLALALPLVYGFSGDALIAVGFAVVVVALATVDLEERRIPNRIVLPAAVAALVLQGIVNPDRMLEWVLAGIVAAAFFLVPAVAFRGSVGMGDVKLTLLMGFVLGVGVVTALLVATFAAGAAAIVVLIREGAAGRKHALPYGPFLAGGALVALFVSSPLT